MPSESSASSANGSKIDVHIVNTINNSNRKGDIFNVSDDNREWEIVSNNNTSFSSKQNSLDANIAKSSLGTDQGFELCKCH